MKLTRQQKVGLAVAVFGVGAVLIDQVFVLGPTQASASAAGPEATSNEAEPAQRSGPSVRMPLTLAAANQPGRVTERLEAVRAQLALTADDADAGFAVASLLAGLGTPAGETAESRITEDEASTAFPRIRVTSMLEGDRPVAFIDGRPYRVGDQIREATIIEIARGRVVFEFNGRLIGVKVEGPGRP